MPGPRTRAAPAETEHRLLVSGDRGIGRGQVTWRRPKQLVRMLVARLERGVLSAAGPPGLSPVRVKQATELIAQAEQAGGDLLGVPAIAQRGRCVLVQQVKLGGQPRPPARTLQEREVG